MSTVETAVQSCTVDRSEMEQPEDRLRFLVPSSTAVPRGTDASRGARGVTIAMASSEREASAIYQLRYRVYVHEQGRRPEGIDWARAELVDALDPCSYLWYAQEDETVVGTMTQTIIGPHSDRSLLPAALELDTFPPSAGPLGYTSRFAIAPGHRGMWVLPSLARDSYAHGRMLGGKFDFMATNPGLVPLFERMGYVRYTRSAVHAKDVGLLIPMILPATDHEYLRSLRSPCFAAAERFRAEPEWHDWLRASHPMIDVYFEMNLRHDAHGMALALWTGLPVSIAVELGAMSFAHQFPVGTTLRQPGDRVTSTFLAMDGRLSTSRLADEDKSGTHCAPDGVPFSRVTIQCETDAVVLCVPDSAVTRLQRRYPEHRARLAEVLEQQTAASACGEGFLR